MSLIAAKTLGRVCSQTQKLFTSSACLSGLQVAGITTANGQPRPRPYKTFDYRKKKFTHLQQIYDRTSKRIDENTRVIVVDGPIASGKHEFAKLLAKELDFFYVPQSSPMDLHRGQHGLHDQDLDELLPENYRIYDLEKFLTDDKPKPADGGGRVGMLQFEYFATRLYTYNDALLHMLSIGQGVVCVRSPWSDHVFGKALVDHGYLTKEGHHWYKHTITRDHLCDFPRPHLSIYLDASVDETLANIKRRNKEPEASSKVLTGDFIKSIEDEYKDSVLPGYTDHGELLIYPSLPNISEHDVKMMAEDIESLGKMEHSGLSDDVYMSDWRILTDEELAFKRRVYSDLKLASGVQMHPKPFKHLEFLQDQGWYEKRQQLYDYEGGYYYEIGFDPKMQPKWKIAAGLRSFPEEKERRHFYVPQWSS